MEQREEKVKQLELTQEMAVQMRHSILLLGRGQNIYAAVGIFGQAKCIWCIPPMAVLVVRV